MVFEQSEILFYIGEKFLNKYDLICVSLISKHFFKSTRRPKLGYVGQNIISKLDLNHLEINSFFNYLRTLRHHFQFDNASYYHPPQLQLRRSYLDTDYFVTNHLIKIILNYFFKSNEAKSILLNETSKTCLEKGIITKVKYKGLDFCRETLKDKHQLFRHEIGNLHRKMSIRKLKGRQQNFRKNFRNCYAIII